ncbi:MAG: asparagine synthase, partial [Cohaesibacteraceae bacterium]|nr:asparagine synthase [Cohaesibacteraceae bacterium]
PSLIPTYLLSRFTRNKVKVALTGDGGDELFAGYDPFAALTFARIYKNIVPMALHKRLRRLVEYMPKSSANMSFDFKVRRALMGLDHQAPYWNPVWLAPLEPDDIIELFNEKIHIEDLYSEVLALWDEGQNKNLVDKTLEFYSNFYLPDNILTKVDRAGMLNGLEARSIFLDNDVVDFARRLPAEYKFDGRQRKKILKKACSGLVPDKIINRPKKGFGVPLKLWLSSLPLDSNNANVLKLNRNQVQSALDSHQLGQADHRLFLWSWSVLQFGKF